MGRVKEWWMDQIEEVVAKYAKRCTGPNEEQAYKEAFEELTNRLGCSDDHASEELSGTWRAYNVK